MIGTAKYWGVRLIDILEDIKILSSEAKYIEFIGSDRCKSSGLPYSVSLPIKHCMDPRSDVLIAYEMNGEWLTPDHGYPIRLVVPGCVGSKSVKWLSKIIVKKELNENTNDDEFMLFIPKDIYVPD